MDRKPGEVGSVGGIIDLSRDSDPDFTALYDLLGLEAPITKLDDFSVFDAVSDVAVFQFLTILQVLVISLGLMLSTLSAGRSH